MLSIKYFLNGILSMSFRYDYAANRHQNQRHQWFLRKKIEHVFTWHILCNPSSDTSTCKNLETFSMDIIIWSRNKQLNLDRLLLLRIRLTSAYALIIFGNNHSNIIVTARNIDKWVNLHTIKENVQQP